MKAPAAGQAGDDPALSHMAGRRAGQGHELAARPVMTKAPGSAATAATTQQAKTFAGELEDMARRTSGIEGPPAVPDGRFHTNRCRSSATARPGTLRASYRPLHVFPVIDLMANGH
jgi:hypothetical protein